MSSGKQSGLDASAFDLPPGGEQASGRAAALCVHGLTGTPYEVRPLAEAIARRGIRALGPLLPGHASDPEELTRMPWGAWFDAVNREYERLRAEHERVFVVGLSLGGLLSLALAQRQRVDALVVVGTPLVLRQPVPLLVPLLKRVVPMLRKRTGSDIRDPQARARHPSYDRMPLAAVHELMRLQRSVRSRLAQVTAPTLVAHGHFDTTAHPRDAARIHKEISASEREILILPSSAHVVPVDFDGPQLSEASAAFLSRHA